MVINKEDREKVKEKSGGHCWYCGCVLPDKGWHVDHFLPVRRHPDTGLMDHPERDSFDNLVPACSRCNRLKSSLDLEVFRSRIQKFVESLNKYHNQYKFAKAYGLVEETNADVVFWFEKNEK